MVLCCFVSGCTNYGYRKGISYHRFPAILEHQGEKSRQLSIERRRRWIAAVNRDKDATPYSYVCSAHFVSGKPSALYDIDSPNWVPSLLLTREENIKAKLLKSGKQNRKKDCIKLNFCDRVLHTD